MSADHENLDVATERGGEMDSSAAPSLKVNPTATDDQYELERSAIALLRSAPVIEAKKQAEDRWRTIVSGQAPDEAWNRFGQFMEGWAMNYVLKAVNSDCNHPKVLHHIYGSAHDWSGLNVPACRAGGGDNPDTAYALVPVDAAARYELRALRAPDAPADVQISVKGNISLTMTLSNLDMDDLVINDDGSFVIGIGPVDDDKARRQYANYLPTDLESRYLFIRDTRSDWRQLPNRYSISRLDAPTAPPLSFERMARRAARLMVDDVPALYWWMRIMARVPPNAFTPLFNTGTYGGLVTQMMSFGRIVLDDDHALVIRTTPGGARYQSVVLYDYWLCSFDCDRQQASLNPSQVRTNADGSTTYVVSRRDPGFHNWLDMSEVSEAWVMCRWQGLPAGVLALEKPAIEHKRVPLAELEKALAAEANRVSADERRVQLARREQDFNVRFREC